MIILSFIKSKIDIIKYKISIKLKNNLQKYIRRNIGFEINKGSFERINKLIMNTDDFKMLLINYHYYINRLKNIPLDKPKKVFYVAVIINKIINNALLNDYTIEKIASNKNIICDRYYNNVNIKKIIKKRYDGILYIGINKEKIICENDQIPILFVCFNERINEITLENSLNVLSDFINYDKFV